MTNTALKFCVIAGEASGDVLGAGLMRAIKVRNPDATFIGVGGDLMQREGLESLFPMEELSVMGLVEVLPKVLHILSRIRQTAECVIHTQPDAVITIDSPDFCFRVIKKVKQRNRTIPCIHYVAPTVWAWREGRAKKVSRFLDHLLALLPFEPPYFERHGLGTTFIGHPIVERTLPDYSFRAKYGIEPQQPLICLLPGSRHGEIEKLAPVFRAAIVILQEKVPHARLVVPTLPHLKEKVSALFPSALVLEEYDDKFACFKDSNVAIAASGTVSLELALTGTPHIIAYKASPITAFLARLLLKVRFVNLINIILNTPVVPELLQEDCNAKAIAAHALRLLEDAAQREGQLQAFNNALTQLGRGDARTPSEKAADAVLDVVRSAKEGVSHG